MLLGDDHICESSTTAHQSEYAMVDALVPVLNPAGVQEILEYGLLGIAMSRFTGGWVSLKCVHDTVESTASIPVGPETPAIHLPEDFTPPPGGLSIRWPDNGLGQRMALAQEARVHTHKLDAARAFARANRLDRVVLGGEGAWLGVVTTGKSWLDVIAALDDLGIDEARARELGLLVYKVGMTWPLEPMGLEQALGGLDRVLVVEEKRGLIESQAKELLYHLPRRPVIEGKLDEAGATLLPSHGSLSSNQVAIAIAERLLARRDDQRLARTPRRPAPGRAGGRRLHAGPRAAALFLPRLPAQQLDPRARGLQGAGRHRLPLHGPVDGPRHAPLHPDGRGGGVLAGRGAVQHAAAHLPERRRRHLLPFRARWRSAPPGRPAPTSPSRSSTTTRSP